MLQLKQSVMKIGKFEENIVVCYVMIRVQDSRHLAEQDALKVSWAVLSSFLRQQAEQQKKVPVAALLHVEWRSPELQHSLQWAGQMPCHCSSDLLLPARDIIDVIRLRSAV